MSQLPAPTPHVILGVHITERVKEAIEVQKAFTCFGRYIKTRLGLHDIEKAAEAPNGLVLVEFVGPDGKAKELIDALSKIHGVEVKSMVFEHSPL